MNCLDTYQMIDDELDETSKVVFRLPYHYSQRIESVPAVNSARSRRLAQEVTSLSTSLPLSSTSAVFVRCDENRMDIMKVSHIIIYYLNNTTTRY